MKAKIILLISILTLTSCEEKKKSIVVHKIKEFKIDIKAEEYSENKYKTNVKTNFPKNTSFTITVTRDYNRKKNPELYSAQYFYVYSTLVKNGEVNFDFNVDEEKWINDYKKIQTENRSFDESLTDIDYKTIKDTLEINVLYTPKGEQNNENIELIGKNGEYLKGEGFEKNEGFNTFSKTIKIYNKFKK